MLKEMAGQGEPVTQVVSELRDKTIPKFGKTVLGSHYPVAVRQHLNLALGQTVAAMIYGKVGAENTAISSMDRFN